MNIDDLVEAAVGENLATSSGHAGARAIERSTRADRSRDPLYNQIKMYAELFRSLGWLHPTAESALRYTFTLLGSQVVLAGPHYAQVVGESALGIAYPSVAFMHGPKEKRERSNVVLSPLAAEDASTTA